MLPGLQVSWLTMSGPGALNDALLSGSIEFVNVAPPSLATLWEKSANTPRPVRARVHRTVDALRAGHAQPDTVKTIADFTDKDRIAVPTAKISGQAMMLQIAAAKLWGFDQFERLDPWTVSMGHPDARHGRCCPANRRSPAHFCVSAVPLLRAGGSRHAGGAQVLRRGRRAAHQRRAGHRRQTFYKDNPKICQAVLAST